MVKKVIAINIFVFAVYALLINLSSNAAEQGFNIAVGMGVCVVIHVLINVIAGVFFFIIGSQEMGKSLLVSAAVLAPIGFCTWLLLLSVFG